MEIQTWMWWMIFAALMIVGEIFTAGFFVLWFGIGAIAAGIAAILGLGYAWQLGVFIVVSFSLFMVSGKLARKISKPQPLGIGADRFVGQKAIVLREINNLANSGTVRLGKEEWRAESENDVIIPAHTVVEVIRTSGTHLVVKTMIGE